MRRVSFGVISLLLASWSLAATYTIGVVPQQSQTQIAKDWIPIIKYLETTTNNTYMLKTERSIPEFEKVLYAGGYDIVYANPYHYIVAQKKRGYKAQLRADKDLIGIIVVNKNSPYKNVSMLKGKRFLFPAPDAFAATMLVKYELAKYHGINLEKEKQYSYVNSHDSVYKGVAREVGDAGGGIERTFNDLQDTETRDNLVVIYKTKAYPSHPIAFKSSVLKHDKEKIVNAFLNMPNELLEPLKIKKMITTNDAEYDGVRDIVTVLR